MAQEKFSAGNSKKTSLKVLTLQDVEQIEQALQKVGAFGEIHLVVEHGRLRFIRTVKSESFDHNGSPD